MKTIEERAILNLQYEKDFLGRNLSDNMVCRAYVAGATEQRKIDIDKAWSLAYSMYQVGKDHLIPMTKDEFIKAMQE